MGNSTTVVERIRAELHAKDRTYAWLARSTGIAYKRLLAEVKHATSPLSLHTAVAASEALGIALPDLIASAPARVAA